MSLYRIFSAMYVNILGDGMTMLKSHRAQSLFSEHAVTQSFQLPGDSISALGKRFLPRFFVPYFARSRPLSENPPTFRSSDTRTSKGLYTLAFLRPPDRLLYFQVFPHSKSRPTSTMAVRARFESSNECASLLAFPHQAPL